MSSTFYFILNTSVLFFVFLFLSLMCIFVYVLILISIAFPLPFFSISLHTFFFSSFVLSSPGIRLLK